MVRVYSVPYIKRTVTWFRLTAFGPIEVEHGLTHQKKVLMRGNKHVVTVTLLIPE